MDGWGEDPLRVMRDREERGGHQSISSNKLRKNRLIAWLKDRLIASLLIGVLIKLISSNAQSLLFKHKIRRPKTSLKFLLDWLPFWISSPNFDRFYDLSRRSPFIDVLNV